ncbi:MAG: PqqD family protein [Butyribacter sp.]|nr:PqqD family protein [bacterium]MDY3853382.1 PqqD family protein [Butyribacter sp.]
MKQNPDFTLRQIGAMYFLVPLANEHFRKDQVLRTNETGALLWQHMQTESTKKELLSAIQSTYDIDDATALSDIDSFLMQLKNIGAVTGVIS